MAQVSITVNGKQRSSEVEPRTLLVHFLREQLNLTGTHVGCDTSQCGACTVLIDDRPRHSCLTLASTCQRAHVETIESLERSGRLSAIQRGFHEKLGAQCGFCTPGMIMAAEGLLRANPDPDEDEIRSGMAANICRCTGYIKIIDAIRAAASEISAGGKAA